MKYTSRRNISLLISAVLLIAALWVFFGLDWPVLSNIGGLNKKLAQEKAQYNEQLKAVNTAKSIINQYKSLVGVSQTISLSIPRGPEIQNIISQLDGLTIQSGLDVQNINFETPGTSTLAVKKEQIAQENKVLRISLSLIGSYESFKTWISSVESNIRLMDIKSVSFASLGGDSKNLGRFNFKAVLDTYYQ